ncbi:MAG: TonB-dependent receptor [Prevotella sp.]|jgi:TonB-linked SusC/RagA family outer membrane protein|nr:TonB-dependent receptor [Prevotella sp.]
MNNSVKNKKTLSKKILCLLAIGLIGSSIGNGYASGAKTHTDGIMEQVQTRITVKGKIIDTKGEPLVGVSVAIKGTTQGTMSDDGGNYTLSANAGVTLVYSYIGYKQQSHVVRDDATLNITLQEESNLMDEVVVVGYGTQKKENLTGAVSSVDVGKTLEGRAIADAGRGLQGTTPGLSIVIPSGEVGSDPTIRIRGQFASIIGGASPLILLDNVEIPSITLINPDDIESISVLKDAASSSIYGSKAAFGVILITSKKGSKTDNTHVTYSGNVSWQNPSKRYEMGGVEAMEYAWIAAKNNNPGTVRVGAFYIVDDEVIAKAKEWQQNYGGKLGVNDPTVYGRDWYSDGSYKYGLRTYDPFDYMIKEWAPTQNHNVSVNGRAGRTTFNIGLNYLDQSGMNKAAKKDKFSRYTASVRVNTELNKHVSINAGSMYTKREKSFPYQTRGAIDPWYYLYRWGPQYPLGADDRGLPIRSPASEFSAANTATYDWAYSSFNIGTVITFTKDWTFNFDYTYGNQEFRDFWPGTRFTAGNSWTAPVPRNDANGAPVYVNNKGEVVSAGTSGAIRAYDLDYVTYTTAADYPNDIRTNVSHMQRNTFNAYTTYNLKLNPDNVFKFMLGMTRVTSSTRSEYAQIDEVTDINNPQFNFTKGEQYAGGNFDWESQLGYFGRINYAFKDRYLVEANLRHDGSSKFPIGLKWRWFPSFSAGWRVSEEAFMGWAKPVLSTLKFRGSYGIIGDQTVPGSMYIATMASGQISWLDPSGTNQLYVGYPSAIASDITWQDIKTTDLGFDLRVLNSEIGLTFDWYQRDTKNMIVPAENVTTTYGIGAPQGNFGNLRTKGWEISVDFNHRFENGLAINGMFTFSDAKTIITEYGQGRVVSGWYNGKTYGEIWGYRTDRLYQYSDFELDAAGNLQLITLTDANGKLNAGKSAYKLKGDNPVYQANLQSGNFYFQPGDVKFKDLDGDGQISTGDNTVENPGDREVIGNTTPRYEYGFRLGADYKGFDFSVFFQGVGKRDMWGSSSLTLAGFNPADGAIAKTLCTDYWTLENTDAFYPRPWPQANNTDAFNMIPQDRYLLNMAYLRLKNITLGYTLPRKLTSKAWIEKARFYVSAENLYTWDHLNGLPVDPEVIPGRSMFATSGDNYGSGRAGIGVPTFKNISIGVQLNF